MPTFGSGDGLASSRSRPFTASVAFSRTGEPAADLQAAVIFFSVARADSAAEYLAELRGLLRHEPAKPED